MILLLNNIVTGQSHFEFQGQSDFGFHRWNKIEILLPFFLPHFKKSLHHGICKVNSVKKDLAEN